MRKIIGVALSIGLFTACGSALDDARAGVPSSSSVKVNVPQKSGALLGQTAGLYTITWAATSVVNTGVVAVLTVLHDIVQQEPTSTSGNVYTWGPGSSSPLDPVTWKLIVTDNGDGTYSYDLDGAPHNTSNFVTVISGKHTPAKTGNVNDASHGSGTFTLDWNARATLPAPDGNVGTAAVTYSNVGDDVSVNVDFTSIKNSSGNTVDATYVYTQPSGADGTFQFSSQAALDPSAPTTLENLTIESRWEQTGAGRSDVDVSGGTLGTTTAQASECWDANFDETYYHDSEGWAADQGTQSACVSDFATAVFYNGP